MRWRTTLGQWAPGPRNVKLNPRHTTSNCSSISLPSNVGLRKNAYKGKSIVDEMLSNILSALWLKSNRSIKPTATYQLASSAILFLTPYSEYIPSSCRNISSNEVVKHEANPFSRALLTRVRRSRRWQWIDLINKVVAWTYGYCER